MNRHIVLRWRNKRKVVKPCDIYYIEGYNRHLSIYTANGKTEIVGKMNDFCQNLPEGHFVRIHQGFTVNMNFIDTINDYDISMKNGDTLPISVRKRTAFLRKYDSFCRRESKRNGC